MSAQRLSPRKLRRLARTTGLDVTRGWAFGGYGYNLATREHRHYSYDLKAGTVTPYPADDRWQHLSTCYGGDRELLPTLEPFA